MNENWKYIIKWTKPNQTKQTSRVKVDQGVMALKGSLHTLMSTGSGASLPDAVYLEVKDGCIYKHVDFVS